MKASARIVELIRSTYGGGMENHSDGVVSVSLRFSTHAEAKEFSDAVYALVVPPLPTTRDELLIAALRHANEVSELLNNIGNEVSRLLGEDADKPEYNHLYELLRKRFGVNSGVYLFIAADNLHIELPADLRGEEVDAED